MALISIRGGPGEPHVAHKRKILQRPVLAAIFYCFLYILPYYRRELKGNVLTIIIVDYY